MRWLRARGRAGTPRRRPGCSGRRRRNRGSSGPRRRCDQAEPALGLDICCGADFLEPLEVRLERVLVAADPLDDVVEPGDGLVVGVGHRRLDLHGHRPPPQVTITPILPAPPSKRPYFTAFSVSSQATIETASIASASGRAPGGRPRSARALLDLVPVGLDLQSHPLHPRLLLPPLPRPEVPRRAYAAAPMGARAVALAGPSPSDPPGREAAVLLRPSPQQRQRQRQRGAKQASGRRRAARGARGVRVQGAEPAKDGEAVPRRERLDDRAELQRVSSATPPEAAAPRPPPAPRRVGAPAPRRVGGRLPRGVGRRPPHGSGAGCLADSSRAHVDPRAPLGGRGWPDDRSRRFCVTATARSPRSISSLAKARGVPRARRLEVELRLPERLRQGVCVGEARRPIALETPHDDLAELGSASSLAPASSGAGGGGAWTCAHMKPTTESARNGCLPVSSS